ncbi:MAG: MarR family transcriptional regulator [Nocardioides sp.]|nr:MarR family transcriptional regulator [Nocardioides sp.]
MPHPLSPTSPVPSTSHPPPPTPITPEVTRLDDQLCFDLVRAAQAVTDAYRAPLGRLALTHAQYLLLLALWDETGSEQAWAHSEALAERLERDPSDLLPDLMRMVNAGLLIAVSHPTAGHWLRATDKAQDLRGPLASLQCQLRERLGMAATELRSLQGELRRVLGVAQEPAAG